MTTRKGTDSQEGLLRAESGTANSVSSSAGLSLRDKLQLLSGATYWKLATPPNGKPQLTVADGPHGLRKPISDLNMIEAQPATCFPTAVASACSWNVELCQALGQALQKECLYQNIQVLLGPGLNLKRHPAGGRNFEYWSEDPYLIGRLATAYVRGVQQHPDSNNNNKQGVGVCVKHFCVNNQESNRFVINAVVDERTARELYYRHFETVVREAQPATIMCAYNQLNGTFCSEHQGLMTDLLRKEWGFEGVVMTDWGATNSRAAGIQAGVDLEMPGSSGVHERSIQKAMKDGELEESQVDVCAERMIELMDRYTAYETDEEAAAAHPIDWEQQYQVAYEVAMESAVLMRNNEDCLPLERNVSVTLIGEFARDQPRYQGMGSSGVTSRKLSTVYDELQRFTTAIHFAPGYRVNDEEETHPELIEEAVEMAKKSQVVILCLGLPEIMESEGFDRSHLQLPAQHAALVKAVTAVHSQVIVVLSNGGVVELPWHDKVQAILGGHLLGDAGGAATVDLLFGVQSPSGKLAETYPVSVFDIPADHNFPGSETRVEYREGLNVGYRYFDTAQKPVLFPFGHGLSYTTFSYTNLQLQVLEEEDVQVQVTFQLTNTGSVAGKEVAQCYVRDMEASVYRPLQELREFCKIELQAGETRAVSFCLTRRAFDFYDTGRKEWVVEKGLFEIRIGSSSRDIRLRGQVDIQQQQQQQQGVIDQASLFAQETYPPVRPGDDCCPLDDLSFVKRFGTTSSSTSLIIRSNPSEIHESTAFGHIRDSVFHRNSLLKHIAAHTCLGKILLWAAYRAASRDIDSQGPGRKRQERMIRANVENSPLRTLVLFSQGSLNFDVLDAMIAMMNWHVIATLKSFGRAVLGLFRRQRG